MAQQAAAPDWAREHVYMRWAARVLAQFVAEQQGPLALALCGDSITARLAGSSQYAGRASRPHPLVAQAEAALGGAVGVFGVPGDTVDNLAWRLAHGGLPAARVLVLQIGANNLANGDSQDSIADKIAELAHFVRARSPSAHVVLLGVFWQGAGRHTKAQAINATLRRFVAEAADPRLHYCTGGDNLPKEFFPDGIHPKDGAWAKVFETLVPMVQGLLHA